MILPTKHVSTQNSILGVGATILKHLDKPKTITALWDNVKDLPDVRVFWRFVLALDFLYAIGGVDMVDGLLARINK